MASKRKASAMASAAPEEPVDPADELMFLCLGGGNEVGRSCHIIQYKGKTIMVCCPPPSTGRKRTKLTPARRQSLMPASTRPMTDWRPSRSLTTSTSAP